MLAPASFLPPGQGPLSESPGHFQRTRPIDAIGGCLALPACLHVKERRQGRILVNVPQLDSGNGFGLLPGEKRRD